MLLRALRSTGVEEILARFKPKEIFCTHCKKIIKRHEEKESDVAMSCKLLEVFYNDECDTVVLITGDTDIAPAVRTALKLFPSKNIIFGFPYKRKNKELATLTGKYFKISKEQIVRHQFPSVLTTSSGEKLVKPSNW
ncbi:MAG: NYN domain-containing protein [Ignavibacteria bacterium]|nr:NYN domain-containing protein [Ignavibacteria bacterium]